MTSSTVIKLCGKKIGSNCALDTPTKPNSSSLERMLSSEMCSLEMALPYLYKSKYSSIHSLITDLMSKYSDDRIDFYLPQLVCLNLALVCLEEDEQIFLFAYKSQRAQSSVCFVLKLLWCLESFYGRQVCARFRRTQLCPWHVVVICKPKRLSQVEHLIDQLAIFMRLRQSNLKKTQTIRQKQSVSSQFQEEEDHAIRNHTLNQVYFIESLISIGNRLIKVANKQRGTDLKFALNDLNMRFLPGNYFIPVMQNSEDDMIVNIVSEECKVLNSKTRAPFIIYVECISNANSRPSMMRRSFDLPSISSTHSAQDLTFDEDSSVSVHEQLSSSSSPAPPSSCHCFLCQNNESLDDGSVNSFSNLPSSFEPEDDDDEIRTSSPAFQLVSINDIRNRFAKNPENVANLQSVTMMDSTDIDSSIDVLCEPWHQKVQRIQSCSPYGEMPGWRLAACIVKSGDDIRQDMLAFQFVTCLKISTVTVDSGLIEPIKNALSLHQIKKAYGCTLREYFVKKFGFTNSEEYLNAQKNFVKSLAGYSIVCYLLQVKDRHNGNILLDDEGHLIHVDYGYMLSLSPKNIRFENCPFKLTQDFVDIMDGTQSDMFNYFKLLLFKGILAARKHANTLLFLIDAIQLAEKPLDCFRRASISVSKSLKDRLMINGTDEQIQNQVNIMVDQSLNSIRTRLYDAFQYYTSGIAS